MLIFEKIINYRWYNSRVSKFIEQLIHIISVNMMQLLKVFFLLAMKSEVFQNIIANVKRILHLNNSIAEENISSKIEIEIERETETERRKQSKTPQRIYMNTGVRILA